MEISLYELYNKLKAKRILFCYSGPIDQSSIEGVGTTLRRNLEIEDVGKATTISVFSIFVEQVQNVLNYSSEKLSYSDELQNELRIGIVVIGHEENGDYFIYCGNKVNNEDVYRLSNNIESIRSLSKDELKNLYKERRRADPMPGSKSTGLGLIEMARKSSRQFEYSFVNIDEEFSFFSIKVVVGR